MKNKKEWKRVCVCMTEEEYDNLRLLASVRKESASKFVRHLIDVHLTMSGPLIPTIKKLRESTAKPS